MERTCSQRRTSWWLIIVIFFVYDAIFRKIFRSLVCGVRATEQISFYV